MFEWIASLLGKFSWLWLYVFIQHSRAGLRGRELMGLVGKSMLQGGGTFGVFMSVGTAIRCWE